jgi:hypothetical protein
MFVFDPKSPWGPWCWSQNHLKRNVATDHGLHWGAHRKITLKYFKRSCNLVCIEVFFIRIVEKSRLVIVDCCVIQSIPWKPIKPVFCCEILLVKTNQGQLVCFPLFHSNISHEITPMCCQASVLVKTHCHIALELTGAHEAKAQRLVLPLTEAVLGRCWC